MIGEGKVRCYEREGGRVFAYITEEGAYVQKRGGNFVIGRNNECVMEIPEEVLEALTLIDSVQVSSQAMVELLRLGVPVTWLSRSGYFFGRLESTRHVNVFRQERQVLMKGSGFYLRMGRKVIAAKVHNQLTLLRRYNRNADIEGGRRAVDEIIALRKRILTAETSEQLMGYEGAIAKVYFRALGLLVPEEFSFTGRSRRPPLDPFNAMLSFGYTLLMYDIYFSLPYLVVSHISVCSPDGFRRLFRCSFCPFFPAHFLTRYLLVFYLALSFFIVSAALTLCPACHSLSADLPCPPQKPLITRSWPLSFTGCAFFISDFAFFCTPRQCLIPSIPSSLLFSLSDRRTVIMTL